MVPFGRISETGYAIVDDQVRHRRWQWNTLRNAARVARRVQPDPEDAEKKRKNSLKNSCRVRSQRRNMMDEVINSIEDIGSESPKFPTIRSSDATVQLIRHHAQMIENFNKEIAMLVEDEDWEKRPEATTTKEFSAYATKCEAVILRESRHHS